MSSVQGRYVGESITFPYVDNGDDWIDETQPRTYFWGNRSCADAEAASDAVTRSGGSGVALRFAMFFADDSAHVSDIRAFARRGVFPLPGRLDGRGSWIHIDDAAAAVVAAIDAPTGVYNVAEPSPVARREHAAALAIAVGRKRLRSIPAPLAKLGGAALESLGRSQRISSRALASATGWVPERSVVDCWAG